MGAAKTYNLAQSIFTIAGIPLKGFGADDALVFTPAEDVWTEEVGADGEVTRSATNNRSGTCAVTLMSTSLSNDLLNGFLQLAKTIGIGDIFPLFVKDLNSGDTIIAAQCWIKTEPPMTFGKAASTREWMIYVADATTIHGGALI